jgi:hypothetical protein
MRHHKTFALLAMLAATVIAQSANAGMSGTSARVQQQFVSEAQSAVQAPAPAAQAAVRPAPPRHEQAPQPQASPFDGTWAVNHSPGCGLGRGSVRISRGRISGPGVSGTVDAAGNVRTRGGGGELTTTGAGRISSVAGSGTYEVSNGCSGTWTAHKA